MFLCSNGQRDLHENAPFAAATSLLVGMFRYPDFSLWEEVQKTSAVWPLQLIPRGSASAGGAGAGVAGGSGQNVQR